MLPQLLQRSIPMTYRILLLRTHLCKRLVAITFNRLEYRIPTEILGSSSRDDVPLCPALEQEWLG
jgi:hypothetical protein